MAATRTIAKILDRYGQQLGYGDGLPLQSDNRTAAVMSVLSKCRSGALGASVLRCGGCNVPRVQLKSCGDRHCATCSGRTRHQWHAAVRSWSLPCDLLHAVTTLPHELNDLVAANPGLLLRLLLTSSKAANLQFLQNRYGVQAGLVAVLHTWGQQLLPHYHVHCVLTAGGLTVPASLQDAVRWRSIEIDDAERRCRELATLFKRLFLSGVRRLWSEGKLRLPLSLPTEAELELMLHAVLTKDWIADIEGTPREYRGGVERERVFGYIARYVGGTAIGNDRIKSVSDERIVFDAKDYRNDRRVMINLSPSEFCRRYALHVLPKGMGRIRYGGLFAPRGREERLEKCRQLIDEQIEVARKSQSSRTSKSRSVRKRNKFDGEGDEQEQEVAPEVNKHLCKTCRTEMESTQRIDGPLAVALLNVATWLIAAKRQSLLLFDNITRRWQEDLKSLAKSHRHKNLILNSLATGQLTLESPVIKLLPLFMKLIEEQVEVEDEKPP